MFLADLAYGLTAFQMDLYCVHYSSTTYILDIFLVHGSRQKHTRLHTLCNFKTPSTYVPTYTIIELWPVNILFRQITMFLKVHVAFTFGWQTF